MVQYKGKSVPMWSLLEEFGWKKVAQKKGADWTFVHQKFNENCSSVYQMVSITKKRLSCSFPILLAQDNNVFDEREWLSI